MTRLLLSALALTAMPSLVFAADRPTDLQNRQTTQVALAERSTELTDQQMDKVKAGVLIQQSANGSHKQQQNGSDGKGNSGIGLVQGGSDFNRKNP